MTDIVKVELTTNDTINLHIHKTALNSLHYIEACICDEAIDLELSLWGEVLGKTWGYSSHIEGYRMRTIDDYYNPITKSQALAIKDYVTNLINFAIDVEKYKNSYKEETEGFIV